MRPITSGAAWIRPIGSRRSRLIPGLVTRVGQVRQVRQVRGVIGPRTSSRGWTTATDALRQRLSAANHEYEHRFGFIYIVCATGKTAGELLAIAERRLKRSRDEELLTAADEQRNIMQIRLENLMA